MRAFGCCRRAATLALGFSMAAGLLFASGATATVGGPGWSLRALAQPANLSLGSTEACLISPLERGCDGYTLVVTNVGSQMAPGSITISDTPPAGVTVVHVEGEGLATKVALVCSEAQVQCLAEDVPAGETLMMRINVTVNETGLTPPGLNRAEVSGGGAPSVIVSQPTKISAEPVPFGVQDFGLQSLDGRGSPEALAGGHPEGLLTSLYLTTSNIRPNGTPSDFHPREEVRDVVVDLPLGFVGDPQAAPKCSLHALLLEVEETACPTGSRIGTVVFEASPGSFRASGGQGSETSSVYNLDPEAGYPAEFGFTYLGKAVLMYASVVRLDGVYRLRVAVPGIPVLNTMGVSLLLFGDPANHDGLGSGPPFFTNPMDCAGGSSEAKVQIDSWEDPGEFREAGSSSYPRVVGCDKLQFHPSLAVTPDTTQADEPSGYGFDVQIPQTESQIVPGTPPLKSATVTLPPGVSVSPSAADGLGACPAEGPGGINIGSSNVTPQGQDLGDPWATELGGGQGGPGESSYDDGLWHLARGHCSENSTVGSVEVVTPLLPKPLHGQLYLAQPGCGGEGQTRCGPADASSGNLFGMYLEAAGFGVVLKLRGSVSVSPTTGQVSVTFRENPQFPFSDLRLRVDGGPRAPLANPLTCGGAGTTADLTPWSTPVTPDVTPLSSFTVDWDGNGGACPAPPLTPGFSAGMSTSLSAGSFSPFTLTLSRTDRQQYLSRLSVTTPPGLLGMLSSVTLCGEPQAAQGACSAASEIGTTTVAAGAGSHPFWVTGHVFLTTGYAGAPFGLSIVVPAKAGPFNLGNIVVRASISVNPETSALTIVSDPLPQIVDGVPLRVQTVNVAVNRPNFMFNPTNCEAHQIAGAVAGAQGGVANVSSTFTAAGCRNLAFSPKFTASTSATTSKKRGASLDVKILYRPGQANIKSVSVALPKQLPSRLTTIQQACPADTFAANPATCPPGSLIGIAHGHTPVLPAELVGPAYLVSHGGAAFPDVVLIIQGEGIRVDLRGSINISKGITSSTFASIPDVPITSFDLSLPEGPHSALTSNLPSGARGSLCGKKLAIPTTLIAQSGLQLRQSTQVAVSGCPKGRAKAVKKATKRRK
jgi:Domain of unknown function DUF11